MNIRKTFYSTVMALGVSISIPIIANAANSADITFKKEDSEVNLKINSKGEYYKIFKGEKLVYKGNDSNYIEKLNGESQKYKIGVYSKNDKLKEVVAVKVAKEHNITQPHSMNSEEKEIYIDKVVQNTRLQTIVDSKSVTLQWPELPDEDNIYEIYRDDAKIAETSGLYYVDDNVESGTEYHYTLKINNVASDETANKIKEKAKEKNIPASYNMFEYEGLISTIVATPTIVEKSLTEDPVMDPILETNNISLDGAISTMAIPNSNEFSFAYRTYIPFKSVPNPNPFSDVQYLKGDNRTTPTAYSSKYRTEANVYAMLSEPAAITLWPDVSESFYCSEKSCSTPKSLGTASKSGINLLKHRVSKNDLMWAVNHSVGVPTITAPKIDYEYVAQLTNKSFIVSGVHDRAPSHEFWMNYPTGEKKIYSHEVTSELEFWNLFGLVQKSWSFDM